MPNSRQSGVNWYFRLFLINQVVIFTEDTKMKRWARRGDTPYRLSRVTIGAQLEDGSILMADNGNLQPRIFGPDLRAGAVDGILEE